MTMATLATRAAVGVCAALMSLAACGGADDSSSADPTPQATEPTDQTSEEPRRASRNREAPSPTREPERVEDPKPSDGPAPADESEGSGSSTMSADEFCDVYTRLESEEYFLQADTPTGARRVSKRLDRLSARAPEAIRADLELMADLYGQIADARGDEDKLAEIDTTGLRQTANHLRRWEKRRC